MAENTPVKTTILEEGTEIEGSVRSKCPITVSGLLKGDVSTPTLTVTETGVVQGKVKVAQLKSQGALAGEIDADSVELSGSISDNTIIRANTLEVKLNQGKGANKLQVSFGNCELQVGDPKARTKPEDVAPAVVANANGAKGQPQPVAK
jgi:cytoskeletal protein CcmA (bactofilin family)